MRAAARVLLGICLVLGAARAARAIETDQYYAWGRELSDSTDVLNAKVNAEIDSVLGRAGTERSCRQVTNRIQRHFRGFLFHDLSLWANNTSLIDRVPATPDEELRYREEWLYRNHGPLDVGTWMPPSPTIELAGVRLGTDKLDHFFSEGWLAYLRYRKGRDRGLSRDEAELRAIRHGVLLERSVLGTWASGVFSTADLEAGYQGMRFLAGLCDDDSPALRRTAAGWELVEPFDFRDYVTPEWDESFQPTIYTRGRWKKVRPALVAYCPRLAWPEVVRRRESYAKRAHETPTEAWLGELVHAGKIEDPAEFSIDRVCGEAASGR